MIRCFGEVTTFRAYPESAPEHIKQLLFLSLTFHNKTLCVLKIHSPSPSFLPSSLKKEGKVDVYYPPPYPPYLYSFTEKKWKKK